MIEMRKVCTLVKFVGLITLFLLGMIPGARSETLDELYQRALKEESTLNFYGTPAQIKIRPAKIYPIGTEEIKDWKKYEKIWKEAFNLR
jgi:hypothetical protein